ncbi:MAG: DUF1232 domain-containing protein [Bacteroidota bacterium]
MIDQAFPYLSSHFWSIFGWAFICMLLWRLAVGFRSFGSAMVVLRKNIAASIATGLALLYMVLPVDFIPDVLLVVGWIDDGIIAFSAFAYARKALSQMIWGDLPVKRRLTTLLGWMSIFFVLSWIIQFGIHSSMS